jgi:hypothetical protein
MRTPWLDLSDRHYSFDLDVKMLEELGQSFRVEDLIDRVIRLENISEMCKEFWDYGEKLARKALVLGQDYKDRTYEIIMEVGSQTGSGLFPHALERFLEIAYLAIQPIEAMDIQINSCFQLTYRLHSCIVFESLSQKTNKSIINELPCQNTCIALCKTLSNDLNLGVAVNADLMMIRDSCCQFSLKRNNFNTNHQI